MRCEPLLSGCGLGRLGRRQNSEDTILISGAQTPNSKPAPSLYRLSLPGTDGSVQTKALEDYAPSQAWKRCWHRRTHWLRSLAAMRRSRNVFSAPTERTAFSESASNGSEFCLLNSEFCLLPSTFCLLYSQTSRTFPIRRNFS